MSVWFKSMAKVHYHSDCPFFAGCENMLVNFFNSEDFRESYRVSFSYRYSLSYAQALKQKVERDLPVYPVRFPDLSDFIGLPVWLPLIVRRLVNAVSRLALTGPVLIYEIIVLFWLFKQLTPDILHINNGGYPAALSSRAAAIAGRLARIPRVIMVVNNMATDYRSFPRWLDYPIDRFVVRSVDQFVTGSDAAAERLRHVLKLPKHGVMAIHNCIALRKSSSGVEATLKRLHLNNYEGTVFGVVALLIPRKGHKILLEAVKKLVGEGKVRGDELRVLIEGSGVLRRELITFVEKNELTTWITFVGDESNIVDFMSALDVLILPSVQNEDFPNVILEAMALGKPVIASRLAGTPEQIIDGVTGVLVEPRNVDQLGEAMSKLMENSNMRNEMGRAAGARFNRHFTCSTVLNNYKNLYYRLMENGK